jgi:hypothetical protein
MFLCEQLDLTKDLYPCPTPPQSHEHWLRQFLRFTRSIAPRGKNASLSDFAIQRGYTLEMTASDLELLSAFAREQSQEAFTALVQRHVNLVYSAALRQVRSSQLAEEVAQSVFTDLARSAAKLKPNTVLTAWLYEVTRRTAINVVRSEARRQLREQTAFEMNTTNATDLSRRNSMEADAKNKKDRAHSTRSRSV